MHRAENRAEHVKHPLGWGRVTRTGRSILAALRRRLRPREGPVTTRVTSVPGGQQRVGQPWARSRRRVPLPYMLIPGMAGPRELGGGLMPLP